ncbi:MAG: SusC/RagA family TonB-linked outer membrane protein [Prevotella sp.]|nr:SusC/RagA family TonB-linked outer membrane protein [Prevotella sp.]
MASLLLCVGSALAQTKVSGTVLSQEDGQPIIGAAVMVVGTQTGLLTDVNGKFTIALPSGKNTLRISYLGYESKDVQAKNGMRVFLVSDAKTLDDVLVIGYGTSKKSAFTGSATEISSKDITTHVTSTATSALVGKVAGITATSSSGAPGSAPTIRIRGIGSYAASSTPLYIVDGVPMEQSVASINPEDIESMSVLKDASAAAIYGNRGANGVIIITTKKAKNSQDAEIKFDAKWGSNGRLIPQYDIIKNPAEYYETVYRSLYNSQIYHGATEEAAFAYADKYILSPSNGGTGVQVYTIPDGQNLVGHDFKLNPNATLGYWDGEYYYKPDNWYDELYHNSFRQEYNVSASGSTGKLNYYASVGFLNDGGQVEHSNYRRYTARTNVEYQAKKWLKLTTNMAFTHNISESPSYDSGTYGSSTNLFYYANSMGAIYPLYVRNQDGSIMMQDGRVMYMTNNNTNQTRPGFINNAARDNDYNRTKGFGDIFTGQWAAVITPITGLNLTAQISTTDINSRYNYLYSAFASSGSVDGEVDVTHNRTFSVNQQYLANYSRTFADLHNVSILVGYEQYNIKEQSLEGYNDHLYDPFIGELNNAKGSDKKQAYSYTNNYLTEGVMARLSYDYDNRFFVNGTFRRDGSSTFAPGHRWGSFWSAGVAWQMNKEKFMQNVKWVDILKLKVSYGENGNDRGMGYYAYADRFSTSYNNGTGAYSIQQSAMGNKDLTWETKKSWNAGVDFALFKNRITGSLEVYTGKTSDLLWSKPLPASAGKTVNSYYINIGTLKNSGIEFAVDANIIRSKDINWNVNLALAHNKNEFTALDPSIAETGQRYSNSIIRVGGSSAQAYMVKYAGVNSEGQALYNCQYVLGEDGKRVGQTTMKDASGNEVPDPMTGNTRTNSYGNLESDYPYGIEEGLTTDISKATRYDIGDILPTVQGGFGTTLAAYGFELTAQFSFQLGGKFYDGGYQQLMHNALASEAGKAMHRDLLDAWSPTNTGSSIPRLSNAAVDDPGIGSQTPQDRFLTNSNYLCLNNLSLGYNLPKKWVTPLTLHGIRVYVAGENLFLLTARKGMDPRYNLGIGSMTSGGGLASGSYSAMRSITAGLTVTF